MHPAARRPPFRLTPSLAVVAACFLALALSSATKLHYRSSTDSKVARMSAAVKQLAPGEAAQYNASGEWKYLDVRTEEEFAGGHAPGAINLPFMLRWAAGRSWPRRCTL